MLIFILQYFFENPLLKIKNGSGVLEKKKAACVASGLVNVPALVVAYCNSTSGGECPDSKVCCRTSSSTWRKRPWPVSCADASSVSSWRI